MAARCEKCGKGTAFGRNIRHKHTGRWQRKAHKTNRQFKANLHEQVIWQGGEKRRVRICTRCLRTQMKVAS